MNVGLDVGKLTLLCAPPSSHKTNLMLNIAWNVYKQHKQNVCYFSLEMEPEAMLPRLIARETTINLTKLEHPEQLTPEEELRVSKELKDWENIHSNKFIMLRPGERTRVSLLRQEIKKRLTWFRPRLVVVDYTYNLIAEGNSNKRSDEEMNGMLDELRIMGMNFGFHVLTAAALTREAIKRIRDQKPGQENLDTGDIMGGQVFGANSDNIYAFIRDPQRMAEQLIFFCLKAREGKTVFAGNKGRAVLRIKPEIALIESPNDQVWKSNKDDGLLTMLSDAAKNAKKVETMDADDLGSIDAPVKRKPEDDFKMP
jgi:hypothetical protein